MPSPFRTPDAPAQVATELLDCVTDGVAAIDEGSVVVQRNAALTRQLADVPDLAAALLEGPSGARDIVLPDRAGAIRHLVITRTRREQGYVVVVRDTTAVREGEQQLRASKERFRRTFESSPVGMALVAAGTGAVLAANAALSRLLHQPLSSLAGRHADDVLLTADGDTVMQLVGPTPVEVAFRRPDRLACWGLVSQTVVDEGVGGLLLVQVEDVTERVVARRALAHQALHDPLTGLANRRVLVDHLEHALRAGERHRVHESVGLLFVDLDLFKQVNDTYGHDAGDTLLREVARRLEHVVRARDRVARLGGDEFVVVVADPGHSERLIDMARRIESSLASPVQCGASRLHVTASVGVTRSRPGQTAEELLREADLAMYRAKSLGRNRFEVFDASLRREAEEQLLVERLLRSALDRGGVALEYQPIYEQVSGQVVAVEALSRLRGPAGEVVGPVRFIPIAEITGLIVPLGLGILESALAQAAHWRAAGHRLRMAVNVSARQAGRSDFEEIVLAAIERHGLPPDALELEITETAFISAGSSTLGQLVRLRDRGVRIAIDDYGTGHASLAYLHRLPATSVKVDATFVAGLPDDQRAAAIVRAVSRLASDIGVDCVAEGVETTAQREWLTTHAPQALLQGNLLARPLPADQVPLARMRPHVASPRVPS
ncbi:MAG: EAL domain-containing protein [Mycobacteriales bacterium]|nr:EAL domain-containing protein [Mycobacteriales bacterium]